MTTFSELGLPTAIAAAITGKKFEQPTPVQTAVMNPELRGRDLLVSSETGSGKTLAFGAVLARELMAAEGTTEAGAEADEELRRLARVAERAPRRIRALVIAPTRELATQVRGELGWLFARTGWRIGAFTGGTDIWGDLRTLKGGVDVVVGTPGRLVDLVSRGALSLADVEAVVLDEADEMLDMGFREDLETLLSRAEARRLTLLFSATLPADILGLAKRYQKDAVRIDTRRSGATPHADIAYVAYLTPVGEKLAAVMNVLRVHEARRAIVFGTTREGVANLHEALVRRGVRAVVLSGDRSQADRDRSLSILKRGEARVLVATNVAARGLDLPEVDLVIHADLPSNVEALTHRSGRTGRAGRKGTSVLIAQLTERRKAERLMGMANLRLAWENAPDAAAVAAHAEAGLRRDLAQTLGLATPDASADGADGTTEEAAASGLTAKEKARVASFLAELRALGPVSDDALVEALVARELAHLPTGDKVSPVALPAPGARERPVGTTAAERRERFAKGTAVFRVNIGLRQNAEPGWLLPLICKRGGVTRKEVGAIRLGPHETTFEIAADAAEGFARAAAVPDPRAPQVRIEQLSAGGPGPRPSPRHAPSHAAKGTREARAHAAKEPHGDAPARAAKEAHGEARPHAKHLHEDAPAVAETAAPPKPPEAKRAPAKDAATDAPTPTKVVATADAEPSGKAEKKAGTKSAPARSPRGAAAHARQAPFAQPKAWGARAPFKAGGGFATEAKASWKRDGQGKSAPSGGSFSPRARFANEERPAKRPPRPEGRFAGPGPGARPGGSAKARASEPQRAVFVPRGWSGEGDRGPAAGARARFGASKSGIHPHGGAGAGEARGGFQPLSRKRAGAPVKAGGPRPKAPHRRP
jgi:ATP-dependent RNA helicase DeaD